MQDIFMLACVMLCRRSDALKKGGLDASSPEAPEAGPAPETAQAPPVNAAVSDQLPSHSASSSPPGNPGPKHPLSYS